MTDFDTLRPLATDLWAVEGTLKNGALRFPLRMSVLRAGGCLWLYSPCPITDSLATKLEALGPVAGLIAPNAFHHLFARTAATRFPKAELCASASLLKKGLKPAVVLNSGPLAGSDGAVEVLALQGVPGVAESVLLHRPSRSLIVADLMFNVSELSTLTRWFFKLTGSYGRPASSRLWRWVMRDRSAFATSIDQLASWDFDRIVMAHGAVVESDGRQVLGAALAHRYGALADSLAIPRDEAAGDSRLEA
jgi:hypothetical protein